MSRGSIAVNARLELVADGDPRAPRGAVSVDSCGQYQHDGPCRWPHNSRIDNNSAPARLRRIVVVSAEDRDEVLGRIERALRPDHRWTIVQVETDGAMYTLTVTVRDLDAVSSVVGVLAETAGDALQIQAIGFGHSDYKALLAAARREAVVDARARAEQLAEAAGVGLGEILGIDEGSGMTAGWVGRAVSGGAREMSAPAMPITPGSQNVMARVAVTWALQ